MTEISRQGSTGDTGAVRMTDERVNSPAYWEWRFGSGHWAQSGGRSQTRAFAEAQMPFLDISADFEGSILDFGCGLGDAMPVYRRAFPKAKLTGVDISAAAVGECRERYGDLATFATGDHRSAPASDVIISSNVLEHLQDYRAVAADLLEKCQHLYIVVPYREVIVLGGEHVNSFHKESFGGFNVQRNVVFACPGWTEFGMRDLWWGVYAKNVVRLVAGRAIRRRGMQIMFHLRPA